MPKIQWTNLPPQLREHLFLRAKQRELRIEDLFALEEWRKTSPDAPEGRSVQGLRLFQDLRRRPASAHVPFERPTSRR
jgi:hypothetical protein